MNCTYHEALRQRDEARAKLDCARGILMRVSEYGPPQGEKPAGTACAFCDMGQAGYSSRGDGFHDDKCAVKDAQLFIADQPMPDTPIIWPSHKCGLYLNHNQHRDYYQSLSEYIAQDNAADFKDEAAQQRAIAADEIWELQWYPHTPVGFQLIAAPTLAEVLAWASEIDKTEKDSAK